MKQLVEAQKGRGFMTIQDGESVYVQGRPHVINRTAAVSVAVEEGRLTLLVENLKDSLTDAKFAELWAEDKEKAMAYVKPKKEVKEKVTPKKED